MTPTQIGLTECQQQRIAKAIADAAPNGRFELLPEVTHSDHHARTPERVIAALKRALDGARTA